MIEMNAFQKHVIDPIHAKSLAFDVQFKLEIQNKKKERTTKLKYLKCLYKFLGRLVIYIINSI